jgi:hypothetical protein
VVSSRTADLVALVHFGFIVFVVVGGVLAWRRPKLLWLHIPAVAWAVGIVAVGYRCPLTGLENSLRASASEGGYEGGFIDRYIEGVIYPAQFTTHVRVGVAVMVLVGWAGLVARRGPAPVGAA